MLLVLLLSIVFPLTTMFFFVRFASFSSPLEKVSAPSASVSVIMKDVGGCWAATTVCTYLVQLRTRTQPFFLGKFPRFTWGLPAVSKKKYKKLRFA